MSLSESETETETEAEPAVSFADPALKAELRRLARPDDLTNLIGLLREYLCIATVAGLTIALFESRGRLGLGWPALAPLLAISVGLMGALQHRLAGLGHESAHFTLLAGRLRNDLVGDFLCLFPLLTSVRLYRAFHSAHHRWTNVPGRDPEIVHMGPGKHLDAFPMRPGRFVLAFHLCPPAQPWAFVKFGWSYIYVNVLGRGVHVAPEGRRPWRRTILGLAYVAGLAALQWRLAEAPAWWSILAALGGLVGLAVESRYEAGPDRPRRTPYSDRVSDLLRLGFWTVALTLLARLHGWTEGRSTAYFGLLWVLPIMSSFVYVMRLRDVYQHANADAGPLTNTRIFRCGPLTRWAVFVYGQDLHVTHHLFPSIPHHRLPELHAYLQARHDAYATHVVECHGTFPRSDGLPSILDVMAEGDGPDLTP